MQDDKTLGVIISGAIVLLIGLVLVLPLSDKDNKISELTTITDDQFTGSNTTCTQITTGCIHSLTSIENSTGAVTIGSGNYTLCTSSSGTYHDGIRLDAAEYNGMTLNATYAESTDCSYVADSTSRTLSSLVVLFFVLGILAIALYYLSKTGLFEMFK